MSANKEQQRLKRTKKSAKQSGKRTKETGSHSTDKTKGIITLYINRCLCTLRIIRY